MKLVVPDALLRDNRLTRYSYLVATLAAVLLLRRAKDSSIPRENMIGVAASLVPTELSHKVLLLNAFAIYYVHKAKVPVLSGWSGSIGGLLHALALVKLSSMYATNVKARLAIRAAMQEQTDIPIAKLRRIGAMNWKRWLSVLLPLPQPLALSLSFPGVRRIRTVTYAHVGKLKTTKLLMDVYKHDTNAQPNAPILLYIHGGGWVIGNRMLPPLPLVYQLASAGWVVCSIDYRLSPMVTFPSHVIDSKRAIAYLRKYAQAKFDADPNFIVVGGESAGGHIASLVALTPHVKLLQPGFEDVDTSVRACIDSYGVHDFTDRHGIYYNRDKADGFIKYLEFLVMQKKLRDHAEDFENASPIAWLEADKTQDRRDIVPPFLVTHGTFDTLVPFQDSKLFYEKLIKYRARTQALQGSGASTAGVRDAFLQIDGAHHMFNYLVSPRALAHGDAVCAFLDDLYSKTKHLPLSARFPRSTENEQVEEEPPVAAAFAPVVAKL
uniref:BD-FAE-like domain-containing protein n=1 Tax=Globisporangium ultimum (strain ATCC 200006 / CBS 805.95 / DAOM BR144) TaxID=431595 RepID=K3WQB4_GLOUD